MNAAVASSSDSPPQPPPAVASSLAPGFRFHPTDDELVSYYLKRKVRGLPLRVDAVAEVDLYRCEPWELPGLSRIRSRDKEWYFFSSLGRKYSTQSRTNRATSQGYWKTTGKDRPVRRGTRVIGMKKTLVFHAGRAPRGTRTNWVMHEYRLDDEELIKTGISQDAYVICRIFEKCGSGPMNGAQYGAPFLEEEWEEEADGVVLLPDSGDYVATKQEFFELSDFMQSEDSKNQQENASNFTADLDRKECGSLAEDATNFPDEIIEDDNFTNLADDPKQQSVAAVAHEMEKQPSADDCIHNQDNPNIKEEYVELGLGDLADTINATNLSYQEYDNYPMKTCHLQDMDAIHQNINLRKMLEVEEYFDFSSEDAEQPEQQQIFQPEDNIYVQPNNFNFVDDGSPSSQDKMALCNAPSDNLFLHENTEINGLLYSPTSGPSDFEMVDDLLAFFDATNDNLHCCSTGLQCISPPDTFDFVEEVGCSTSKATTMVPHTTIIDGASSSGSSVAHVESGDEYKEIVIKPKPDDPTEEPNNKTAKKHLMSVLGAISPRAPFSEFPSLPGKLSAAHVASPVHVTAGIIQIYGSTIPEDAANGPLQKNGRVHFILSYSVVDDMVSKTAGHDLTSKYQINPVSTSLQGGLYLIFVSWLILAIAYGVGMRYMAKKFYTTDS